MSFSIAVQLCDGRYFAASHKYGEAEYPPHPVRLQMALINAWASGGKHQDELDAILFLERLPPPSLYIPDKLSECWLDERGAPIRTYVPIRPLPGGDYEKAPLVKPGVVLKEDVLHFIWHADLPEPHRQALAKTLRRFSYLGGADAFAIAWLDFSPPSPTHVPTDGIARGDGLICLRVFTPFNALEEHFRAYQDGNLKARERAFSVAHYRLSTPQRQAPPQGHLKNLLTLQFSDRSLPLVRALSITQTFRKAVARWWTDAYHQPAPRWLIGHEAQNKPDKTPEGHAAFLALPFVGHPHANGDIKGVAIATPTIGADYYKLQDLLFDTQEGARVIQNAEIGIVALSPARTLKSTDPTTWLGPSTRWGSVTPVVLHRYPKPNKLQEILAQCFVHAGLPVPKRIEVSAYPLVRGAKSTFAMPLANAKFDATRQHHVHVAFEFDTPVLGPISLGRARFIGYGLCYPLS